MENNITVSVEKFDVRSTSRDVPNQPVVSSTGKLGTSSISQTAPDTRRLKDQTMYQQMEAAGEARFNKGIVPLPPTI
ncbi:MAG: hypothetical protein NT164_06830 [Verrucomicrobiae bacterium]|nr:hypothetical protein [Verrucomicrobiae bacterium]